MREYNFKASDNNGEMLMGLGFSFSFMGISALILILTLFLIISDFYMNYNISLLTKNFLKIYTKENTI